MSQLKTLQRKFQETLQGRDAAIGDYISKPPNMDIAGRVQVYCNDYYLRLRDALKEDYEKLCQLVGESEFEDLVEAYIDIYPSETYTLREVGYRFPNFLKEQKKDPAYIELAQFECSMIRALFSEDADTLKMDALAKISPEDWSTLQLQLHPAVHTLISYHNTLNLWLALENNEEATSTRLEDPITNLIWRNDHTAYFCTLSPEETVLLNAIKSGENFAALCEKMLEHIDEENVVQWVAGTLQQWITDGIFLADCPI